MQVVINTTKEVSSKLKGKYGYARFLRDGYNTPLEDKNRLHFDPLELEQFDRIECQWPMFICFQYINKLFEQNNAQSGEELKG